MIVTSTMLETQIGGDKREVESEDRELTPEIARSRSWLKPTDWESKMLKPTDWESEMLKPSSTRSIETLDSSINGDWDRLMATRTKTETNSLSDGDENEEESFDQRRKRRSLV